MKATLCLLAALVLSIAGNGWQLYSAGGAKPKCDVKLQAEVQQQNTATGTDQHQADQGRIKQLQGQLAQANLDNASDSSERAGLQTKLHAPALMNECGLIGDQIVKAKIGVFL